MSDLRIAKVAHVHPEGQKLEVIFLDTGDIGRHVQVVSPYAGTDFGFTGGIPAPEQEGYEENIKTDPNRRDIFALIGTIRGRHYVLGFVYPQITHMAFTKGADPARLIERHTSDFYRTINDHADMDMVHPAGPYIRIGEGGTPDALAGRDYDARWKIQHNTGRSPTVTVAGLQGAHLTMDPGGNITLGNANARLTLSAAGNIRLENNIGSIEIAADGTITTKGPRVVEDTPDHETLGIHTDAIGHHS